MRIYYDTEFIEDGQVIDLVSIGMVAEDGREFYAVSSEFDQRKLLKDPWLRENVWPSLPTTEPKQYRDGLPPHGQLDLDHPAVRSRAQIAQAVAEIIRATPGVELWAWYGGHDHVALCQLWGRMVDLPAGVPKFTNDLRQEVARLGNPPLPEQAEGRHHALADARHLKTMAESLEPAGPVAAVSAARPSIGRMVHYVSYGTPGGEYTSQCRAAIITAVHPSQGAGTLADLNGPEEVDLAVLNPTGLFFNLKCRHSEGQRPGGSWHWPERVE